NGKCSSGMEYSAVVCKSQYGIPVRELWSNHPCGFEKGVFAMFRGYIDESGDGVRFFTLACLISSGEIWDALESEWANCLDAKNRELKKAGRKAISRYHAADCSSFKKDFEGWSKPEHLEFVKALLAIFNSFQFNVHSYSVNLHEMVEEI